MQNTPASIPNVALARTFRSNFVCAKHGNCTSEVCPRCNNTAYDLDDNFDLARLRRARAQKRELRDTWFFGLASFVAMNVSVYFSVTYPSLRTTAFLLLPVAGATALALSAFGRGRADKELDGWLGEHGEIYRLLVPQKRTEDEDE